VEARNGSTSDTRASATPRCEGRIVAGRNVTRRLCTAAADRLTLSAYATLRSRRAGTSPRPPVFPMPRCGLLLYREDQVLAVRPPGVVNPRGADGVLACLGVLVRSRERGLVGRGLVELRAVAPVPRWCPHLRKLPRDHAAGIRVRWRRNRGRPAVVDHHDSTGTKGGGSRCSRLRPGPAPPMISLSYTIEGAQIMRGSRA
jgi:hypothetical protein